MRGVHPFKLTALLLAGSLIAPGLQAQDPVDPNSPQIAENTANMATYLINLGAYLGYNITQSPQPPISPMLSSTVTQLLPSTSSGGSSQLPFFTLMVDALLGAIPVSSSTQQFVPSSNSAYSNINSYANATFLSYNNTSNQQTPTNPSVSAAIDQQTYQQDPVSQAVLNILGTPDYSYCMNNDGSWNGGTTSQGPSATIQYPTCSYLNEYQVMSNVIGTLPTTFQYYTYCYNQQFLNQLNTNTLLAPLMYSTTASTTNQSSCQNNSASNTTNGSNSSPGLKAQNQLQEAENFIRYATGAVNPGVLPKLKNYDQLYNQATALNSPNNPTAMQNKIQAQSTLVNYFSKLRSYAAQSSVAYSNFYYIFSKRVPQKPGQSGSGSPTSNPTSQALTEFTMATWRLFSPDGSSNPAWMNQINQASSASVQKEIATLLAEINYQLYLNRQQEERMLLTENMLLLLNTRTYLPIPPVNSTSTGQ